MAHGRWVPHFVRILVVILYIIPNMVVICRSHGNVRVRISIVMIRGHCMMDWHFVSMSSLLVLITKVRILLVLLSLFIQEHTIVVRVILGRLIICIVVDIVAVFDI